MHACACACVSVRTHPHAHLKGTLTSIKKEIRTPLLARVKHITTCSHAQGDCNINIGAFVYLRCL